MATGLGEVKLNSTVKFHLKKSTKNLLLHPVFVDRLCKYISIDAFKQIALIQCLESKIPQNQELRQNPSPGFQRIV